MPPGGIRTSNPRKRAVAEPRLKTARPLRSAVSVLRSLNHYNFPWVIPLVRGEAWYIESVDKCKLCSRIHKKNRFTYHNEAAFVQLTEQWG
jgi:hypothetical protein